MKTIFPKTLLLLLINLLTLGICSAQDLIDYARVGLMKADYDHRAVLYLGNSQKAALAILGSPTAKSTYYSEVDEINLDVWTYGNSKLYFSPQGLVEYNIADPTIAVGKDYNTSFRIGNNKGSDSAFHGLPIDAVPGKSRNLIYNAIAFAGLKSGGTPLDFGVEVLFNASGNVFNICLIEAD